MLTEATLYYVRFIDDFPAIPVTQHLDRHSRCRTLLIDKVYVVQTIDESRRALPPHDHRPRRPGARPDLRQRHDGLCRRAVGPALDHQRHQPRRPGAGAHAPDGGQVSLLPAGRLARGHQEGSGTDRQDACRDLTTTEGDIQKGFVYKRVPHVTLKSIANNPDIKEGMTREEIDAAIARHADTETLYDQPYEDNKRVRVCGPFTVESLSPHRVLSTTDEDQDGTVSEQEAQQDAAADFATMILDNLQKGGRAEHPQGRAAELRPARPLRRAWLHAAGEYTDADGKTKRVAVSIGPEHGTVGPSR